MLQREKREDKLILKDRFEAYPALFRSLPVLTNQEPSQAPASCRDSAAGGHHTACKFETSQDLPGLLLCGLTMGLRFYAHPASA